MLPKRAARLRRQHQAQQAGGRSHAQEGEGLQAQGKTHQDKYELPYKRLVPAGRLPSTVTWRGTGADGPGVYDQANCGSCWTFAAGGAMEAAWFKATGQTLSFSQQQVLDCRCVWHSVVGMVDRLKTRRGGVGCRMAGVPADLPPPPLLRSWGYNPRKPEASMACDGGDPEAAIGYVAAAGGLAVNGDYPCEPLWRCATILRCP